MTTRIQFDPRTTKIDDLMAGHPATMAVFNAFGVDSCCGAQRSVHDAAEEDQVAERALVEALERAMTASA